MDMQNVLYPYNRIVFSNRKDYNSGKCYKIDEPQKIMLSKLNQSYIIWIIYMKYAKETNV